MVKLQRRFAYKYKDKEHYKYQMTIPEELVQKLQWKDGVELDQRIVDGKLVVARTDRILLTDRKKK